MKRFYIVLLAGLLLTLPSSWAKKMTLLEGSLHNLSLAYLRSNVLLVKVNLWDLFDSVGEVVDGDPNFDNVLEKGKAFKIKILENRSADLERRNILKSYQSCAKNLFAKHQEITLSKSPQADPLNLSLFLSKQVVEDLLSTQEYADWLSAVGQRLAFGMKHARQELIAYLEAIVHTDTLRGNLGLWDFRLSLEGLLEGLKRE